LNFHRKGAKNAETSGFSLAVQRNGKGQDSATRSDMINWKALPFSFPLSQRKAEKKSTSAFSASAVNLAVIQV